MKRTIISVLAILAITTVNLLYFHPFQPFQPIPNAHASETHPFRFHQNNRTPKIMVEFFDHVAYLPIRINQSNTLYFILDTGAFAASGIDEKIARKLNLQLSAKRLLSGVGDNPVASYKTPTLHVTLDGLDLSNQTMMTVPLTIGAPFWGKTKHGLLGGNFLHQVVTEIDYAEKSVRFYDPKHFQYKGNGTVIPIEIKFQAPFVRATLTTEINPDQNKNTNENTSENTIEGLFLIDSGLRGFVFNVPFHQRHHLIKKCKKTVDNVLGFGINGEARGRVGRLKSFTIGTITFNQPVVAFSTDKGGALTSPFFDGAIGTTLLHRFRVFFDYSRRQMILEEHNRSFRPFEYDMSGIYFIARGPQFNIFEVYHVVSNSPATDAGIKKGDVILAIDQKNTRNMTMETIKALFKQKAKTLHLQIQRNNQTLTIPLTLKPLI